MQRSSVRTAAVAVLCILALSAAAATLDTSTEAGEGGGVGGGGSLYPEMNRTTTGTPTAGGGGQRERAGEAARAGFCIPALRNPLVMGPLLGLVVAGVVALGQYRDWALSMGMVAIITSGPLLFFWLAVWYTVTGCQRPEDGAQGAAYVQNGSRAPPGGGGAGGSGTAVAPPDPPVLMLAVVGVALVAAVAVIVRGTRDDLNEQSGENDDGALVEPAAIRSIAETAGAAADRIEADGEVDNEVYRAWREMTDDLDVERPASSTPAEFREAAVEAGMAPEHVDRLTALFEEVRYGGYEPTAAREQQAVDALRRIENAYGDGGGADG